MNLAAQLPMFDAVPCRGRPVEPIFRSAKIEGDYRFVLRRKWGPGPCIVFVMLNPSRANAIIDDPTLLRIMGFAYRWGYGSLIVLNLFPYRSPSPRDLQLWLERMSSESMGVWRRNVEECRGAMTEGDFYVAAWGNGVPAMHSLAEGWLHAIGPVEWHCLGITASGQPTHPLARGTHRIPDDRQPMRWERRC